MITQNFNTTKNLPTELDSSNTLIIVFYSKRTEEILNIKKVFPKSTIIGCSSAGEIFNNNVSDDLVISITKFENSRFSVLSKEISLTNSFDIGKVIGLETKKETLSGMFILSEGLNINASQLTNGLREEIKNVPIYGGLAGDAQRFKETSILYNDKFYSNQILAISFYGNVKFNYGIAGGWIKFGPMRKITKAKDTTVFEIDGQPALDLYKEYLGKEANNLPASALLFPLSFKNKNNFDLTRTILAIDEKNKAIILAGEIPEGSNVSLMHAEMNDLVDGSLESIKHLDSLEDGLNIAISCVGRRIVMGEYAESELDILFHSKKIKKLSGFYSYGEISPFKKKSNCELHNQTAILLNISE